MAELNYPWPALVVDPLRETQRVEYKAGLVLDSRSRHKLRLAALAMANTEDGGYIVIGVAKQPDKSYAAVGISSEILTRTDPEELQITLSKCGSPSLSVSVELTSHDGKNFILITVEPSRSKPVICIDSKGSEGEGGIRTGVIYYRTAGPESKSISAADWDELWRRFASLERVRGAREHIGATGQQELAQSDQPARDVFDQLAKEFGQ